MKKVALVIGSTGLVGKSLVDQLVAANHIEQVITLTRRPVEHVSAKVVNHVVDFDQLEQHASLFQVNLMFSCLGTTLKQAGSIDAQRKVDFEYQLKAAELAAEKGVSHYLLVSSSGANDQSPSAYFKMKGELEKRIKLLNFERISIFQPSLLMGERKEFRLAEKLGSWLLPSLCLIPGLRRYRPITGMQVATKMHFVSSQSGPKLALYRLDELFEV
ncbi:NAD(P)H-binding protein [Marinomonas sp. PE14-40]|uniref:NAD(P)H-binding protein n=1 Tax=Marinomonas sp. PE14-40 TaxID=3060621 RepID=UPI003F677491